MKNPITLAINLLIATIAIGQTVSDIDGNTYPIIEINDQEWMGENLKTSRYNDGTPIQSFTEEDTWINLTDGAHGVPDVTDFEAHYGKLYNWHAVQTNKLCPAGWVIPSPTIWRELIESESLIAPQGNLNTLGTQLKSGRQVNHPDTPADAHPRWDEHDNRFGTDQFGFAALPAGNINPDGSFHKMGNYAYFWTSGSVSETHATAMVMLHSHKGLSTTSYPKAAGFSVRCIKSDDTIPPPPIQYTLTITTEGNGSTNPAAGTYDYEEGTTVDLTATADDGWEFDKWVIDGEDFWDASTSITMNNDVNATAHFTESIIPPTQYTLTIATEGNGSTNPAAGTYDYE
ncbi:MAG: FISUMP domain-containing protein, partial [Bacteroidales bacterium]